MMIKKILLLSLVLFSTFLSFAQVEHQTCVTSSRNYYEWPAHNNWFIGEFPATWSEPATIVNFSAGFTTTDLQSDIAPWHGIPVYEGITSASDDNGNLVVFSNGRHAFDATGKRVSTDLKEGNEGGTNIVGSAAQGIMSVRHPLTPDKYYFITTSDVIGGGPNVSYNIFNASGVETQGNTAMPGSFVSAEGITATLHANGVDIWVAVQEGGSANIHVWLLTCDGFEPAVVSALANPVTGDAARGGLAFNHDGTKMASIFGGSGNNRNVVYDFNKKTGVLSNRQGIAANLGYDLVWTKDNQSLVVGGLGLGNYLINATTGATTTITGGPDGWHHTVEIGADGNYYFNGKDGLWRWAGSGSPTRVHTSSGQGLPTMYMPPAEEPDIQEVGPFCDTNAVVDVHTYWVCSGVSSEDTINNRHSYWVLDPNDPTGATKHANSANIIGEKTGFFDPRVAKVGTHKIVFEYCDVNDTIEIEVTECLQCIDTLVNTTPEICAGPGGTLDLATLVDTANAKGYWTFGSTPATPTNAAVIDSSTTDTLFSAVDPATSYGVYKMIYTVYKSPLQCKDSINIIVNKPPVIEVNNDTICAGDAAATFTATSDSTVQTYLWADEGSGGNQTTTGTTAGIYTVLVTDNNGCEGRDTGTLVVNALPVIAVNNDTICLGDPDATFTATSDSVVDTYLWADNGSGGAQTTTGSAAGIYTVLVTDENGCTGRDTGTLVVNALPVISVNDSAICAGDPAARFTATSDSVVDTYLWADEGSGALQTADGTTAGIYTVTVTDVHGCIGRDTGTLVVNALPVISVNDSTICVGDPAAEFTATSDSIVDTYLWGDEGSGSNQTTSGTTAGLYTVTVTDVHGCIGRDTGTLSVNALPVITVNDSTICSDGGPALFTATSDTTAANYVWGDNGAGTDPTTSGTVAGIYTVLVIDKNGCTGRDTGEMFINLVPVVTVNSDTICAGDPDATFTATSDTTAASYVWSDNGFGNAPTSTGSTAGDYTVTVTDKNGCVGTGTGVLTVNALPVITVNDSTICAGGLVSAEFTATSDTTVSGPGSGYVWSSLGTGTLQTTSGTTAGDYTVTVTDKNGCVGTGTGVLKLSALPVLSVNDAEICIGDPGATFTVTSDTAVATYAWSGNGTGTDPTTSGTVAGDYVVNIVDVNGCIGTATGALTVHDLPVVTLDGGNVCPNTPFTLTPVVTTNNPAPSYSWDTGENTPTIQKGAGTYTVTVTDGKGCIQTASATVVEDPNLQPIINGPIDLCEGEDTLLISNYKAVDGYDFVWSFGQAPTGDVTESITVNTAGTYGLFVSKGNCQGATTVEVIVNALPTVTMQDLAICDGDPAATFTATSATATSYVWSDNGTGTSPTTSGSVAGDYTVVILDDKGCTATATAALTVNPLPTVTVNSEGICIGDPAATFTATSASATGWTWSGQGTGSNQTTTGTNAGDYTVLVSDVNGCEATATGTLVVNSLPLVTVNSEILCPDSPTPTFTAASATATAWTWSENGTGTDQTTQGRDPGNYTVEVSDVNGCTATGTGELTIEPFPVLDNDPGAMCEGNPVTIGQPAQGSGPFTYEWFSSTDLSSVIGTDPSLTINLTLSGVTTFHRSVVNTVTGCRASSQHPVTVEPNPDVNVEDDTKCDGELMTLEDTYPSAGYSYIWNPGVITTASINPTASQAYTITKIDDVTGCTSNTTATATFIPIPNAEIDPDTVYLCQGEGADLVVNTTGSSTLWNNGSTLESITVFSEGVYTAVTSNTISNITCTDEDAVYVKVTDYPVSMLNQLLAIEPLCFLEMDTGLTVTANTNDTLNFLWNTGEETNSISVFEEGTYSVNISSNAGPNGKVCEIADQITFRDFCPYTFYAPNAFTPNDVGSNEIFTPKGTHLLDYELVIFDRWGLKIFTSNDINVGWDGKYAGRTVQQDVYVWKANFTVATYDGSTKDHSKVGHVTLIK